jgi:O-antigen ligase
MPFVRHPFWSSDVGEMTAIKYLGGVCLILAVIRLSGRPGLIRAIYPGPLLWSVAFLVLGFLSAIDDTAVTDIGQRSIMSVVSFLVLLIATLVFVDSPKSLRTVLLVAIASMAYASLHLLREWQAYGHFAMNYRPGWIAGDPNYFTISALIVLPITYHLLQAPLGAWERRLCLFSFTFTLIATVLAASRGGFLAGLGAGALILYRSHRPLRKLSVALAVGIPLLLVAPASPLTRLLTPAPSDTQASDARTQHWSAAIAMFSASPFTGTGLGTFRLHVPDFSDSTLRRAFVAHNSYLELAAELGLPGFIAFVGILVSSYRAAGAARLRTVRSDTFVHHAVAGLQPSLLAFGLAIFFLSAHFTKLFWLMVFITARLPSLIDSLSTDAGVHS